MPARVGSGLVWPGLVWWSKTNKRRKQQRNKHPAPKKQKRLNTHTWTSHVVSSGAVSLSPDSIVLRWPFSGPVSKSKMRRNANEVWPGPGLAVDWNFFGPGWETNGECRWHGAGGGRLQRNKTASNIEWAGPGQRALLAKGKVAGPQCHSTSATLFHKTFNISPLLGASCSPLVSTAPC